MMSLGMAQAIIDGAERGATTLTVLYDRRCPLCRRLKSWLAGQPTTAPVEFVAAGSAEARGRYPRLDHDRTLRLLTVVTPTGAVYEGERAWMVCAWALPRWQPWAEGFGGGLGLPVVAVAARVVDGYRHRRIARAEGGTCENCRVAARPAAWAVDER